MNSAHAPASRTCAWLFLVALSASRGSLAQDPAPAKEPPAPAPSSVTRMESWPKPKSKDQVLKDIERVCKAHIAEMALAGKEALLAAGASAVPLVLERYGKERDPDAAQRLREILIELTTPEQSRLLGKEFESRLEPVRTFVLWRTASFRDAELLPGFEAAWAKLEKQGEKADPDERYAAALCGASVGSIKGFEVLFDRAMNEWDKRGTEMRRALEAVRTKEASEFLGEKMKVKDRKTTVAALHMLAGCGDKASVALIWPHLSSNDNTILIAAINAMRGVVDGDQPIDQLSAFEAIEMAKKWKTKN